MERVDVAIVGAGPAGSSTAVFLARRGYSVAVIDKRHFPREKLCGDFLNPVNWGIIQNLGVAGQILASPHEKISAFALTTCFGEKIEVPFPTVAGAPAFGVGMRRFYLDNILFERAKADGVIVHQGSRVQDLNRIADGWSLNTTRGTSLSARVLVGADGRNSSLAHRLKLARPTRDNKSALGGQIPLIVRQSDEAGAAASKGIVQIHLFPGGYAGVANVGDGLATLGFAVKRRQFAKCQNSVDKLIRVSFSRNSYLKEILQQSEPGEQALWTSPVYFPPRRSYGDRFVLVGDAARVNEPVSGEGVYFALKSGEIAARTIDEAFRAGDLSSPRLRSYELQCRSIFRVRRGMNFFIRQLVYRPAVVSPLIRLSKRTKLIEKIVQTICQPEPLAGHVAAEGRSY